jgi:hypothetical protein
LLSESIGPWAHGQVADGLHRIFFGGVDQNRRPEFSGEGQLFVAYIHGDNGIGSHYLGCGHGRKADTADAEDGHTFPFLYSGGMDDGPGAGHDRATDDGRHVLGRVRRDLDHILFVHQGVIGPGEDVLTSGQGSIRQGQGGGLRQPVGGGLVPGDPGDQHQIPFLHMRHSIPFGQDHAGGFMTQKKGGRPGTVDLVELAVADAAGELFDHDLKRSRIGKVHGYDR